MPFFHASISANRKLIVNNHEKYYREMLAGGMMADCEDIPPIEETARWAASYFWETLYMPYRGVPAEKPKVSEVGRKMLEELMPLFFGGNQGDMVNIKPKDKELLIGARRRKWVVNQPANVRKIRISASGIVLPPSDRED